MCVCAWEGGFLQIVLNCNFPHAYSQTYKQRARKVLENVTTQCDFKLSKISLKTFSCASIVCLHSGIYLKSNSYVQLCLSSVMFMFSHLRVLLWSFDISYDIGAFVCPPAHC